MVSQQRIVVLGGGFGGAAAARELSRRLGSEAQITLIDRQGIAHLCGAHPLLIVGERPVEGVTRSLGTLAEAGVDVVTAEIEAIELDRRRVVTHDGAHGYDHLVVALGAGYDWEAIPGSADAHGFYDHTRAVRLRDRLSGLRSGTVAVAVASPPIKCPPAPMEAILAIDWWARRRRIRDDLDLHLFIPEPAPLGVAGPDASARVAAHFESRQIALHVSSVLTEITSAGGEARFADGTSITADVLVVVPTHRLPPVVVASGLGAGRPWVPVDPGTLETGRAGVFAIGDVNSIPLGDNRAVPKAGVFAAAEGATVAAVIASRLQSAPPPPAFQASGHCFLAFSGEESAMLGGTFMGSAPGISLSEPSTAGMAAKVRWESDWQAFRI